MWIVVIASAFSFCAGCMFAFRVLGERVAKSIVELRNKIAAENDRMLEATKQQMIADNAAMADEVISKQKYIARPCRQNVMDTFAKGVEPSPRAEYLLLKIEHQLESLNVFAKHGPALGDKSIDEFEEHTEVIRMCAAELEGLKTA